MTNTQSNEAANIAAKLIAGVMQSEQSANNRQTQLVLFMFNNEVTYSTEQLGRFFKVKGTERTTLIENALTGLSDDYNDVMELANVLANKRKEKKETFTDTEGVQLEQFKNKLRAANMLFIRAVIGVYYLRKAEAYNVKVSPQTGAISFYYYARDEKGEQMKDPKGNLITRDAKISGNDLVRRGQKDIDADFQPVKKAAKSRTTPNPVAGSLVDNANVVANRVRIARMNGKGLADLDDKNTVALDGLLKELFAVEFMDDKGNIDLESVKEYVAANFKEAKPKPVKKAA